MRAGLLIASALALSAQTSRDPTGVLAHTRDNMIERMKHLPNYTCVQTVNRQYFARSRPEFPLPSCDQMSGEAHKKSYQLKLISTDRLRLDVKVSIGVEIGSWAGANRFDSRSIMDLVGGGPFGTGPFGPLLQDIFVNNRCPCWPMTVTPVKQGNNRKPFVVPLRLMTRDALN